MTMIPVAVLLAIVLPSRFLFTLCTESLYPPHIVDLAVLASSKCTIADEARVVQCSAPLMDHYIPSHMVVLSLSGLDQFCSKYEIFKKCTDGISGKCM